MVVMATRLFTVEEANSLLDLINPIIIELSDFSVKQEMLEEQLEEIMATLHELSLVWTACGISPPRSGFPHVTIVPSWHSAANALPVEAMVFRPHCCSNSLVLLEIIWFPRFVSPPQVMTRLPSHKAAKALSVEKMVRTPFGRCFGPGIEPQEPERGPGFRASL